MVRTAPISFRIEPVLKEALEKAAKEDMRSLSSMVEKILTGWCQEKGYLERA
jgi:hypothetical protein